MKRTDALEVPKYCRHKQSGQAYVRLNGQFHYLGRWRSTESKTAYRRLVAEYIAAGGVPPAQPSDDLTVAEIVIRHWKHVTAYYRKHDRQTSTVEWIRAALKPVRELYGDQPAASFGPLALKAVRQTMLDSGRLNRTTINKRISLIVRMFKWAVENQLIGPTIYEALKAVESLKQGRCSAPEPRVVPPVDDAVVEATLPKLQPTVAAMVQLQRLTGARPEEVCTIRPIDVDTSGELWEFIPASHKTEHCGRRRVIYLGPKAQDVLRPFLLRRKTSFCFAPEDSIRRLARLRRENRQTPMTPSQLERKPKQKGKRRPGQKYTAASYRRAIVRAVEKVNRDRSKNAGDGAAVVPLPQWAPNQLRHTAGTVIRRDFGLEAAQVTLGHAKADVTQVYAERDAALAMDVMRKIG